MDDEGTGISEGGGVFRSQPDFKMREGAVPVKDLDDEGKGKTREMEDLHPSVLDSPKSAEEKEDDPEKVKKENNIRKYLIKHFFNL
jgi:hypothetical protein